jgi:hypothetical protein
MAVMLTVLPSNLHFILLKFHKPPQIPDKLKDFYKLYINSYEWRKIRRKRLEKDGFRCQNHFVRIVNKNLHVHHKTYRHLGNEKLTELITLCEDCHNEIHKRKTKC